MSRIETLTVGTDGSCLRNPNGPTGWAYICHDGDYAFGGRTVGTNQIGELMAIVTVLRDFPRHPLEIQSDSAYAIGCSSTWKTGWQRAGYTRKSGPIANLDIIREIHHLLDVRDTSVRFIKVKAHLVDESVHPLNVRADELAGRGARAAHTIGGDVAEYGTWPIVPGAQPVPRGGRRAGPVAGGAAADGRSGPTPSATVIPTVHQSAEPGFLF